MKICVFGYLLSTTLKEMEARAGAGAEVEVGDSLTKIVYLKSRLLLWIQKRE